MGTPDAGLSLSTMLANCTTQLAQYDCTMRRRGCQQEKYGGPGVFGHGWGIAIGVLGFVAGNSGHIRGLRTHSERRILGVPEEEVGEFGFVRQKIQLAVVVGWGRIGVGLDGPAPFMEELLVGEDPFVEDLLFAADLGGFAVGGERLLELAPGADEVAIQEDEGVVGFLGQFPKCLTEGEGVAGVFF